MQRIVFRRWLSLAGCGCLVIAGSCSSPAADVPAGPPATVAQAAAVLDLSKLPLLNETKPPQHRNVAGLSYDSKSDTSKAFDFHRQQLIERKFTELPGTSLSEQGGAGSFASGAFARDGFRVAVAVFPASQPGEVSVSIINQGNIALDKLPVPPDAKLFLAAPAVAMYVTESPAAKTADACSKLLAEKGWQPYGNAGDVRFFKQNAIRLTAQIASAPAQGGKTMISYSSEQMSSDLPAPADAIGLQYADVVTQLSFDSKGSMADVVAYYRTELAKSGWEATTDKPFKMGFKDEMIFRNPAKDLLTLEMRTVEGNTRVMLKYQSAAEVEAIEKRIKEKLEKSKVK